MKDTNYYPSQQNRNGAWRDDLVVVLSSPHRFVGLVTDFNVGANTVTLDRAVTLISQLGVQPQPDGQLRVEGFKTLLPLEGMEPIDNLTVTVAGGYFHVSDQHASVRDWYYETFLNVIDPPRVQRGNILQIPNQP